MMNASWHCENLDKHPLRYSPLRIAIESILLRRIIEQRISGFTLEAALEIADAVRELQEAAKKHGEPT
jgi:hypothetical protein